MGAKEIRLARIFNPKTGNAVNVPVDHGSAMGAVLGLTDPVATVKKLIELGIDSTLMNKGLAKITEPLFVSKNAPGRILTADLALWSTTPGAMERTMDHELVAAVEEALRGDFAAMKVCLIWGHDQEIEMKNLKLVADLATECDRWNMPLMVEPVMWGDGVPKEKKNDPELIEHAARVALELGADVLKMPYTGDLQSFAEVVRRLHVPVLVLGGPRMESLHDALQVAHDSVKAGARGVVFGRNVWQNPQMDKVVRALQDIIHGGADVATAMTSCGLN